MSVDFRMVDLIAKKRNGEAHSPEEIRFIINGVTNESIPDYQLAAWLMAVCLKGMNFDESYLLTDAMAKSGDIIDLSSIGEFIYDKHSTGGVGDKATIVLIPLLAAAGLPSAKLSGRGLGHTGGTIDKLEAIPGFKTSLDLDELVSQVQSIGAAIASQTAKLAPADGRIYALRDVTCTVDNIPLIAASVVSKKVAAGSNIIVLDVKCGNGAFMKTLDEAKELSRTMVEIGKRMNKSIVAVITSMDQPLGNAIGNSLEIIESIDTLKNKGPEDLKEICLTLGAIGLVKAHKAKDIDEGKKILSKHLEDGSAFEKFKEIVKIQDGNVDTIDHPEKLPTAKHVIDVISARYGYVNSVEALSIAKACKLLGAGREKKGDPIDYSVGVVLNKKVGQKVSAGEVLARVHANSTELGDTAVQMVLMAYEIVSDSVQPPDLIYEIIG